MEPVHRPVLVDEVLALLEPQTSQPVLVDATLGEGGHSVRFLQRYPGLRVVGLDVDEAMMARARERLSEYSDRVTFVPGWFDTFFATDGPQYDLILMDLGISMFHLSLAERGFSFRADEPLDMRLEADGDTAASDLVNTLPETELANLIYEFGEERYSRRIASRIVRERAESSITTTKHLADAVWRSVPQSYRHGRIHPATRTFQALRIAVNDELGRVRRVIPLALARLSSAGRLGIIAFHSLEDRIVKHAFRAAAVDADYRVLTKKPVVPTEGEADANPAARSAKLRVIERSLGDAA